MPVEECRGEKERLDRDAASAVAAALTSAVQESGRAVLGVVGGRSVAGIYAELAERDLPWTHIHIFMADERIVPIGSKESNWQVVHRALVRPLDESGKLPRGNAHPFEAIESAPDAGIGAYASQLQDLGGRFDVVVLSAGEDGHTASLFPNHPSVQDPAKHFVLVENAPKPPPRRLSASRALLAAAGSSVIVFYGEGKADALARFRNEEISVEACPSKLAKMALHAWIYTDT